MVTLLKIGGLEINMDVLKDKQTRSYNYISRYATFPFYYNTQDDKYIYGLTKALSKNVDYIVHKIEQDDTLDGISFKYYGRPDLFWVVADYNDILDPFVKLWGTYKNIKVPSLSMIGYNY